MEYIVFPRQNSQSNQQNHIHHYDGESKEKDPGEQENEGADKWTKETNGVDTRKRKKRDRIQDGSPVELGEVQEKLETAES